jgi:hypothetical protein
MNKTTFEKMNDCIDLNDIEIKARLGEFIFKYLTIDVV